MKTMKVCKFKELVRAKKDKVLSLSVTYCGEDLIWRASCGVIVWDRAIGVGELYPDGSLDDALKRIEGGRVHVVFSDLGEVTLRLRP